MGAKLNGGGASSLPETLYDICDQNQGGQLTLDELLKCLNNEVTDFVRSWQERPYCWLQEIDIQVEFARRFLDWFPENQRCFTAKHDHEPTMPNQFSRVTCEPYVKLTDKAWMHPDIVIWSDRASNTYINSGKFPIDLICEIKYSFDEPVPGEGKDHERLLASLESESRPRIAVQLVCIQKPCSSEDSFQKVSLADGRLIQYRIYLPSTWGANAV